MKVASTFLKTKVNSEEMELLVCPYMVGDILITTNEINPNNRYKGTKWQKIENESFLMSASETYPVKSTGGENEHQLTTDELPSHTHKLPGEGAVKYGGFRGWFSSSGSLGTWTSTDAKVVATNVTGKSVAHNNMPKFFAVYFWLRVV